MTVTITCLGCSLEHPFIVKEQALVEYKEGEKVTARAVCMFCQEQMHKDYYCINGKLLAVSQVY